MQLEHVVGLWLYDTRDPHYSIMIIVLIQRLIDFVDKWEHEAFIITLDHTTYYEDYVRNREEKGASPMHHYGNGCP